MCTFFRAKTSGDLGLCLDHSEIALCLVVIEGNMKVSCKKADCSLEFFETINQRQCLTSRPSSPPLFPRYGCWFWRLFIGQIDYLVICRAEFVLVIGTQFLFSQNNCFIPYLFHLKKQVCKGLRPCKLRMVLLYSIQLPEKMCTANRMLDSQRISSLRIKKQGEVKNFCRSHPAGPRRIGLAQSSGKSTLPTKE